MEACIELEGLGRGLREGDPEHDGVGGSVVVQAALEEGANGGAVRASSCPGGSALHLSSGWGQWGPSG